MLGLLGLPFVYATMYYLNIVQYNISMIGIMFLIILPWFANSKNKVTYRDELYKDYEFEDAYGIK